jgi:ATP-dependent Zn protease
LFDRAWKLLRRYRKAHAALVEALLEKSLLTYEDCVAIWEANRG